MSLVLVTAGAWLLALGMGDPLQLKPLHVTSVGLVLDEGPDLGGEAPGGGIAQAPDRSRAEVAPKPLAVITTPPEESQEDPATIPERLPSKPLLPMELQPLLPGLPVPGQDMGIGSGHGGEVGNGLGAGRGGYRGATWIHSARGDVKLKVSVNYLDFSDYVPPKYPDEARLRRISGDVVLEVTIDSQGHPIRWEVVEGDPLLVAATLKVFPQWHFIPPVYQGEKVGATFEVRIRFTLV